jgi:N-acetylglucosaminyl-diphospho-decaprenol L-rhamnosyltransferase
MQTGHSNVSAQLSIVIVSWNTRDLLARCLESVLEDSRAAQVAEMELFVVDNASVDGSSEMVRERFPEVRLIESQRNLGFARANNLAIRQCTGRYVLLLNPDTEVRPGALAALLRFMEECPEAGAAGARLLNPDGSLQPSCDRSPTLSRELWRLLHLDALWPYAVYRMHGWSRDAARAVDAACGACLILRREALREVGLLDEDYFIYSEEVDLCRRLRQSRWQIFWVPWASVVHYGGQSTRQAASAMFLRLYQGKVLYFRKSRGRRVAELYKLIVLVASLGRLLLSPLAWLERPPRRQQHLALAGDYRRLVWAIARM